MSFTNKAQDAAEEAQIKSGAVRMRWPRGVTGEGTLFRGAPSPCGTSPHHYCCRQFGYCLFGNTPTHCVAVPFDKVNAALMAAATWLFFLCAGIATYMYQSTGIGLEGSIGFWLRSQGAGLTFPYQKYWCIALAVNAVLSLFPTYYCITICNIFKAKIIANQAWNSALLLIAIAFYYKPFEGFTFMMFGMGWSVAMFTVTAGKVVNFWHHGNAPALAAAGLFIFLIPCLGISAAMEGTMSNFYVFLFLACFFFGFMVWSSMEGYTHFHQFATAPDARLFAWKGPMEMKIPLKSEVPVAWDDYYLSAWTPRGHDKSMM